MISKNFYSYSILILILLLQLTVVELISYKQYKPDLLLIGLVFFTLQSGQIPGIITAFIFGLLFDILGMKVIGANALSKVIATFFIGYFFNENEVERLTRTVTFTMFVLLASIIDRLVYVLTTTDVNFKSFLIIIINNGLIPALITGIFSLFVLFIPSRDKIK